MQNMEITEDIIKKINKRGQAREDFDAFLRDWIKKYELNEESYRGIALLMSAYVDAYLN